MATGSAIELYRLAKRAAPPSLLFSFSFDYVDNDVPDYDTCHITVCRLSCISAAILSTVAKVRCNSIVAIFSFRKTELSAAEKQSLPYRKSRFSYPDGEGSIVEEKKKKRKRDRTDFSNDGCTRSSGWRNFFLSTWVFAVIVYR